VLGLMHLVRDSNSWRGNPPSTLRNLCATSWKVSAHSGLRHCHSRRNDGESR